VARKNKAIISGIAGFAGSYLAELLLSESFQVFGIIAPGERTDNVDHLLREIETQEIDIVDRQGIGGFINKIRPDYIFHLAAMASVGQSIQNERLTYHVNVFGSLNILESAVLMGKQLKKIVMISSADCYGIFMPPGKILKENQPLNPISPYGISKAMMENLTNYYIRQYKLPAVIARSFNHTGPRQSDFFVTPSFCRQISMIENGKMNPEIHVGDLSAKRDLSDVRDIVQGYYLLADKGKAGEAYQLSSGKAVSIREVLDILLALSPADIKVQIDKNLLRKSDIPILRGNSNKARKELGWISRYKLEKTLKDTLQYWRDKVGQ